jgi:hypothetical protein
VDHVGLRLGQDLVAGLGVAAQRQLVGHGAAGHEQRGFLAEQSGRAPLQLGHGRVLAVDVVADLGRGHGRAHGGGRAGEGIAMQVDRHGSLSRDSSDNRNRRGEITALRS